MSYLIKRYETRLNELISMRHLQEQPGLTIGPPLTNNTISNIELWDRNLEEQKLWLGLFMISGLLYISVHSSLQSLLGITFILGYSHPVIQIVLLFVLSKVIKYKLNNQANVLYVRSISLCMRLSLFSHC